MACPMASSGSNCFVLGTALLLAIQNVASDIHTTLTTLCLSTRMAQPRILVFDVNETLLDLTALRPEFQRTFRSGSVLSEWFALLLQYASVVSLVEAYADFGTVGGAVLDMLANVKGVQLAPADRTRILQGLLTLPPHADVPENLARLRAAGFQLVTLTNSSAAAIKAQ